KSVDRKNILAWARPTLETTEKRGQLLKIDGNRLFVKHADGGASYLALPRVKKHLEEAKIKEGAEIVISSYVHDGALVATWIRHATILRPYFDDITVRVNSEPLDLKPGERVVHQFMLYNGPVKTKLLGQFSGEKAVDP